MGFYQARQYEKAMEQSKLALDLDRTNAVAHEWLGFTYLAVSKKKEAVAELEEAVHFSTDQNMRESVAWSRLGYLYGETGQRKQAEAVLTKLRSMSTLSHVPATDFALVYIGLGEKSLAFSWLNRAYEEHALELALMNADPRFDSLRSDPRFQELIRRMNFPK
jgi:tetratricopeptide (TPR) repeat protein